MARKHKPPDHANHERWLVSYADFITLLFAFFTVLYATAQTDSSKTQKLVGAVQKAFKVGVFQEGANQLTVDAMVSVNSGGMFSLGLNLKEVERTTQRIVADSHVGREITIKRTREGIVLSLKSRFFFDPGSVKIKPEALPVLTRLARVLKAQKRKIRVEGHSDGALRPGEDPFANWDLSGRRAVSVLKFLEGERIQPWRLSVGALGPTRPLASNLTREGRALNRRVDLVVVDDEVLPWSDLVAPSGRWQSVSSHG